METKYVSLRYGVRDFRVVKWNGLEITSSRWDHTARNFAFGRTSRWLKQGIVPRTLITNDRPVIFDVGANVGLISMLFARIPGATVYSFEPGTRPYYSLRRNMEANNIQNVRTFNFGMSDEIGPKYLAPFSNEQRPRSRAERLVTGRYSLYADANSEDARRFGYMAEFITLDSFIKAYQISRIDYLKIDTEGHELAVLKGAMESLAALKPVCQLECHPGMLELSGTDPKEIDYLLASFGYSTFASGGNGLIAATFETSHLEGHATEIYALPPGHAALSHLSRRFGADRQSDECSNQAADWPTADRAPRGRLISREQ